MNFNYTINFKDPTIESVINDEIFYDYDKTRLHNFDKSYEELYFDILNDDYIVFDYIYPKKGFDRKYIKDSINIWKSLGITLHNINIVNCFKYYKEKEPKNLHLTFKNVPQYDSRLRLLEKDEATKQIIFNKIVVARVEKKLASTIYAHEMTHAQMLSQNGATNSIFYEEMIPIFMEYVFASVQQNKNETLKYVQNERLMSLCKFLSDLGRGSKNSYARRVDCEKYIISSIQAIKLFDIYYSGDNNIKKEILNDINKLFEGTIIVEDIISKYNVYYDNVSKDFKSLKLKF